MANSYLDIAYKVLAEVKTPLGVREILAHAHLQGVVPPHLYGKTQQKTLGARLSEDIRRHGFRSQFYRTQAGRYFLSELRAANETPRGFRDIYFAPRRDRQLRREKILTFSADCQCDWHDLREQQIAALLHDGTARYQSKRLADRDVAVVQLIVYVVVIKDDFVLASSSKRRKHLTEQVSIGFRGNLTDVDNDLFNTEELGLRNASMRILHDEIGLSQRHADQLRTQNSLQLRHFIKIEGASEQYRHVAAIVRFVAPSDFRPLKNLSRLAWMDTRSIPNDISKFDPWAQATLDQFRLGSFGDQH